MEKLGSVWVSCKFEVTVTVWFRNDIQDEQSFLPGKWSHQLRVNITQASTGAHSSLKGVSIRISDGNDNSFIPVHRNLDEFSFRVPYAHLRFFGELIGKHKNVVNRDTALSSGSGQKVGKILQLVKAPAAANVGT